MCSCGRELADAAAMVGNPTQRRRVTLTESYAGASQEELGREVPGPDSLAYVTQVSLKPRPAGPVSAMTSSAQTHSFVHFFVWHSSQAPSEEGVASSLALPHGSLLKPEHTLLSLYGA